MFSQSFSHVPCQECAQSEAYGQTIATMDGSNIISNVNLSWHMDIELTTVCRSDSRQLRSEILPMFVQLVGSQFSNR